MPPSVTLSSGFKMPLLGLGTWNSEPGKVTEAVKDAIELGYRHIDCALAYQNETEVGAALRAKMQDKTIKREEVFITSKLWNTFHSRDKVLPSLKQSLSNLGLAYLDLYLIHWPMGYKEGGELFPKDGDKTLYSDVDFMESWKAMEEAVKEGLVRSIGLSNFNKDQIERVINEGTIPPAVLQVECHPQLAQVKLIDYCKSKNIAFTAYSPLGTPNRPWAKPDDPVLMEHPKLLEIAKAHNKTTAQILIAFQIQRGVICIPKSVTKSRIEANMQVFDFKLSDDDMKTLLGMDCGGRILHLDWIKDHPLWPFNTEF